ncbi:hypothetical protein PENSPDRAFT_747002 [Peniophora sp. CONT]|nr:hypothetical protein PENSPDRAFT_747002 [Peniophora sp. CONT]
MSFRRSNKSAKVPNVKLRPVHPSKRRTPPPLSTPTSSPPFFGGDDHEHDISSSFIDPCPRPLRGVVLCATGVDKSSVFSKAQELGASTSYDFTDRVTHLIAEQAVGQKYQCAVERQIPILRPSWIEENHEIWLRGDMFDVAESIEDHRLPIFSSVILCLSGFSSVDQRTEINRLVTKHGGEYVKELRRPVKVTHLLCTGETETDKMKYARRFNKAREANIKLVWEEWFHDSIRYGGRFNEEAYSVDLPRPSPKPLTQPSQHFGHNHALESLSGPAPSRQLTSATASHSNPQEELDEVAPVRAHVPAVTLQVWESLLKTRGYIREGAQLVRTSPSPKKPVQEMDVDVDEHELPQPRRAPPTQAELFKGASQAELHPDRKGHSALSSFSRTGSFTKSKFNADVAAGKQPFRRSASVFAPVRASPTPQPEAGPSKVAIGVGEKVNGEVFSGLRFRALGEAKSPNVRSAVESCGGTWIEDVDDDSVDYIIVRLVSGSAIYRSETDEALRAKYRTECWLEGCLSQSDLLPPTHHISFTPLPHSLPLPGASRIILSHSGLDAAEETWLKRLARALGITHASVFSPRNTHLLCPSGTGKKWEKAGEWGVRVVGMEWFEGMVRSGEVSEEVGRVQGKGKGKEKIVDVTNRQAAPVQKSRTMPDLSAAPNRGPSRAPSLQQQAIERARTAPADNDDNEPLGKQSLLLSSKSHSSKLTPVPPTRVSTPTRPIIDGSDTEPEEDEPEQPEPGDLPFPLSRVTGIPSSRTPSPMKLPKSSPPPPGPSSSPPCSSPAPAPAPARVSASPSPVKRVGSSPMRPIMPPAAVRALHESLSVLGKRSSTTLDPPSEPEPAPRRRRRPRGRPPVTIEPTVHIPLPQPEVDDESYEVPSFMVQSEKGPNVVYEDAGQREERLRLMRMLGEDVEGEVGHGGGGGGGGGGGQGGGGGSKAGGRVRPRPVGRG